MKKIITVAYLMLIISVLFAFGASAAIVAGDACGENLAWSFDDDGTFTITGSGPMMDYDYNIPWKAYKRQIKNLIIADGVTSIGNRAFSGCTGLKTIVIPKSVKSIGDEAFRGCSGLASVELNDGLKIIGTSAFSHCTAISSVKLPASVIKMGDSVFLGCTTLKSITMQYGLTNIGDSAFWGCTALNSVDIPDSVKSIGDEAFRGCSGLVSVTIPGSVINIGEQAFKYCNALSYVMMHDGVNNIGDEAFSSCESLVSADIPKSVNNIGNGAFKGCVGLASVVIPDNISKIGDDTFWWCTGLVSVYIPAKVTNISKSAFGACTSLKEVSGAKGSFAEAFAKENGYTFIQVGEALFDTLIILTINDKKAIVNGDVVTNDVEPILENSRTMLPARFVAETLGASVSWNDKKQMVSIKDSSTTIEIVIGENNALVNGKTKKLDAPAFLRNSRTYTPVRFICESLGAKVEWVEETQRVIITK